MVHHCISNSIFTSAQKSGTSYIDESGPRQLRCFCKILDRARCGQKRSYRTHVQVSSYWILFWESITIMKNITVQIPLWEMAGPRHGWWLHRTIASGWNGAASRWQRRADRVLHDASPVPKSKYPTAISWPKNFYARAAANAWYEYFNSKILLSKKMNLLLNAFGSFQWCCV